MYIDYKMNMLGWFWTSRSKEKSTLTDWKLTHPQSQGFICYEKHQSGVKPHRILSAQHPPGFHCHFCSRFLTWDRDQVWLDIPFLQSNICNCLSYIPSPTGRTSDSGIINMGDTYWGDSLYSETSHDVLLPNVLASHREIYKLKQQEVSKGIICSFSS